MSLSNYPLTPSQQAKINELYNSRLQIALIALIFQALIIIPMARTFLFIISIFNIPAIIALIACTLQNKAASFQTQRTTKFLLKIGVAKTIGSLLLVIYAGVKYASITQGYDSNLKMMIQVCLIYLGGSALGDILYSVLAFMAIAKTKSIMKILKNKKKLTKRKTSAYIMKPTYEEEESHSSSNSCSEEESSEKMIQNRI